MSASTPVAISPAMFREKKEDTSCRSSTMSPQKEEPKDVTVVRDGKQIVLPEGMSYDVAIEWMKRKKQEDEQIVAILHEIDAYPLDGAVALQRALEDIFGWVNHVPTPGFWGDSPPMMVGVPISPTETIQVPWGRVKVPSIEGYFNTGMTSKPYPKFIINGEVKQKHKKAVQELVEKVRYYVQNHSIYKGKAVRTSFSWERKKQNYDPIQHAPKFMDVSAIDEKDLIFGTDVQKAITYGIFTPIERTEILRKHKIPLKRGVLLAGPYGTGKTLTAYVTAKKSIENGWTFIYLDDVQDLAEGLRFAQQYAPAVVFSEDVDRIVCGDRTTADDEDREEIDNILNTLDGVDSKRGEIITVLTTNHLDVINQAILRPGRLDTLVLVEPPDAEAIVRLLKLYGRDLIDDKTDLRDVASVLEAKRVIPAVVREVVERSKIAAIARGNDDLGVGKVSIEDLLDTVKAMEAHQKLLEPKQKDNRGILELSADAMGNRIGQALVTVLGSGRNGDEYNNDNNEDDE